MYQATRESGNWSSKFVNLCVSTINLCVVTCIVINGFERSPIDRYVTMSFSM